MRQLPCIVAAFIFSHSGLRNRMCSKEADDGQARGGEQGEEGAMAELVSRVCDRSVSAARVSAVGGAVVHAVLPVAVPPSSHGLDDGRAVDAGAALCRGTGRWRDPRGGGTKLGDQGWAGTARRRAVRRDYE